MSRESSPRGLILKRLSALPQCRVIGYPGTSLRRNQPDLFCCYRGQFFCFEVKAPGKTATPGQRAELAKWQAAGAITGVVSSWDEVHAIMVQFIF